MHHREEIPVGTLCRIREWEDLAEEFGVDPFGDIPECDASFTEEMRYMCGKLFTVASVYPSATRQYHYYRSEEGVEDDYTISGDMLELVDESDFHIEIPSDFSSLYD